MNIMSLMAAAMLLFTSTAYAENKHLEHQHETSQKPSLIELMVYKTPTCGCCTKWMAHLEQEHWLVHSQDFQDISSIKSKYNIQPNFRSCHTAVSRNGYAFEGHVPAKFIKKFLTENHPDAIGLSVPAMPLGSPGMEMDGRFMPYHVLLLHKDGSSSVYAEVQSYEEQF